MSNNKKKNKKSYLAKVFIASLLIAGLLYGVTQNKSDNNIIEPDITIIEIPGEVPIVQPTAIVSQTTIPYYTVSATTVATPPPVPTTIVTPPATPTLTSVPVYQPTPQPTYQYTPYPTYTQPKPTYTYYAPQPTSQPTAQPTYQPAPQPTSTQYIPTPPVAQGSFQFLDVGLSIYNNEFENNQLKKYDSSGIYRKLTIPNVETIAIWVKVKAINGDVDIGLLENNIKTQLWKDYKYAGDELVGEEWGFEKLKNGETAWILTHTEVVTPYKENWNFRSYFVKNVYIGGKLVANYEGSIDERPQARTSY